MLDRHLIYLLAVARHGSFTQAARELHVSQPALSQQIRLFEERLGKQLLERGHGSVRPTDIGSVFIAYAKRALDQLEAGRRAVEDVEDLSAGTLRLGYAPSYEAYLIGPLVGAFHRAHPGVRLKLQQLSQERIEADLATGEIDIGLGFDRANRDEIEAVELHRETMALIVGKHRERDFGRHRAISPKRLSTMALVLFDRSFATRLAIDSYFRAQHIEPIVAIEAGSVGPLLHSLLESGLATILPMQIVATMPGLKAMSLNPPMPPRQVVLLIRRAGYRNHAEIAFVAMAVDHSRHLGDGVNTRLTRKPSK